MAETAAASSPRFTPAPLVRGPVHELVAAQLRDAIISGELPPGSRLPTETELCESFGVSRATIREALGSLVGQGLIEKTRGLNGGSFVLRPSVGRASESLHLSLQRLGSDDGMTVDEVVESRLVLEVPAARLAARRHTEQDLAELRACEHRPRRSRAASSGDRRYHRAVAVASGNRLLQLAIEPINLVLGTQLDSTRYPKGFLAEIDAHHQDITDAIAAGDEARSAELMREHLEAMAQVFSNVWKRPG